MQTLDGVSIEEGLKVYLLQTPVLQQHEFLIGTVVKISSKTVHVQCFKRDKWYSVKESVVLRSPNQLIAVRGE